jgi:hypothetical protein
MAEMYLTKPVPTDGLNRSDDSSLFDKAYSPYMKNVVVERTFVRKRRGYSLLGSTGLPLSGTGMAMLRFVDSKGASHLIALTSTKAYLYDSGNDEWDDISPAAGAFTGDADNRWNWTIATDTAYFTNNGGGALIITNGVDDLQEYEGQASDVFLALVHGYPSFSNAKEVQEFWNHLFIVNYNDGSNRVRTIAHAVAGDVNDWSSDTAGNFVLTDTQGELLRAVKLGFDMVLYSTKSISVVQYIGEETIFQIPTYVHGFGLLSNDSVINLPNLHLIMCSDFQTYAYYGSINMVPVGRRIDEAMFSDLDIGKKERICSGVDVIRRRAMLFIPTAGEDYAKKCYATDYSRTELPWEYHEFADSVRGMATFEAYAAWYCDEAPWVTTYCDESAIYCDDGPGQVGAPIACFISDDGYVYQLDEATGKDYDDNITFELQTPDFIVASSESLLKAGMPREEMLGRWQWFSFTAKADVSSSVVSVHYSTDGGGTWTQFANSPVSLETSWKTHRLPFDTIGRRVRFRIYQSSDKDVKLRGLFRVKVVPQTERD